MLLENLRSYIYKNASDNSINRASVYNPKLKDSAFGTFIFDCKGSNPKPYQTEVEIQKGLSISSKCSCPYDAGGICKHQVAAIEAIIEMLKSKEIDEKMLILMASSKQPSNSTSKAKVSTTFLKNEEGVIDVNAIRKIRFRDGGFYYNPVEIIEVSKAKIIGKVDNYREKYTLSIAYFENSREIALNCSCKSTKPCYHKKQFLDAFLSNFSPAYFSPHFEENIKENVLKDNNLDGVADFDDIFKIEITTDGVEVVQTVPNIISNNNKPLQLIEYDKKELFIPNSRINRKAFFSYGLCLEIDNGVLVNVYPFSGKLNKSKTKIISKLNSIKEYELTSVLQEVENPKEKNFIVSAVQLSTAYQSCAFEGFQPEDIQEVIENFSVIIDCLNDYPILRYNSNKSFIKKNTSELIFKTNEVTPCIEIKTKKSFYQINFYVKVNNKTYSLDSDKVIITPFGAIINRTFYPITNPEVSANLMQAAHKIQINVVNRGVENLMETVIEPLSSVFEINFSEIKESKIKTKPKEIEKHIYLSDEEGEYIVLQPLLKYGEKLVSPESKEKIWADNKELTYFKRNSKLEHTFLSLIKGLHPKFENKTNFFYISVEEALASMWLMEAIEKLKSENVRVFGLNDLKSIKYNLNKPSFSIGLSSGEDWFDMKVDIKFGDQKVDLKQLQKSIIKQSNYVELKDGTIGLLPDEWIEKYKKYFKVGQVKKGKIEISNYQFNVIDELYEDLTNTPKFLEELYEKKQRLANLKDVKPIPKPKNLKATLRPYQKEGLNWLVFLHNNKLGGCLADDMGLGKTLQTIAFIQYLKNKSKAKENQPHLIVAPTSLVFNWTAEIEKFAPQLKAVSFIGSKRKELKSKIKDYDIVLTTYGSIIKDIEFHKANQYNYVILDESQAIKNPQSQRFKAVRLLRCENRLALTGTPIENNTFDLYSQFNFLNPGIFGSVKNFKANFSDAIDKEQDKSVSDLLARMISPFLLRRTKDQVAKELPSKTEGVIYCEMEGNQRKVYDSFKQHFRQKIAEQIEDEGVNKSQMYILQGLTKLRQICNSTALADKDKDYGKDSSKLDELIRQLNEKVGNHKVLIFSQFVEMLKLVRERLEIEGIKYEYLDGQTKKRADKVNTFQNDKDIRVFLISLKAGGTGLNLTEADYVYLIDPWWNPAVENQAIDRCYRIGQDKKVMAYRMICKDSIEEKIVKLQNKKKSIASDVVRVDNEKKSFNKKDVELFFGEN